MTMKAARWHKAKDLRVENVEIPEPGPGQVKLAVEYTGICGSDLHEYLAGPIFISVDSPHPLSGAKAPITMGHEFSGKVVAIGDGVENVKDGDLVTVEPIIAKHGLTGYYNLDPQLGFVGLSSDGGFAEYVIVDSDMCHILPEGVSTEQAAMAEPAAVALYAVRQSKLKAGDTAAVFGCGPIGLMIIESLKIAGATDIYAVELSEERLKKAEHLGAIPLNPNEHPDIVAEILERSQGGVDVSFEVTGVAPVLKQSLEAVKNDGECVIVSIWESEASLQPNELVIKEKTMKGTIAYRYIFPQVLKLMQECYFSTDNYVTKHIALDDIVDEGFELLVNDKSQIKILVSPK